MALYKFIYLLTEIVIVMTNDDDDDDDDMQHYA